MTEPDWRRRSAALAISLSAMQEALRRCFLKIYETRDASAELKWFSNLEDELIRATKDTIIEGAAMSDEVIMVDEAIAYLRFAFDGVRREIANKSKGK
jgi:hypothetical protein